MSSSVFTYNITGTPQKFLIHSVELQSKNVFAPITPEQQLIVARVNSKLELIFAGAQETEIEAVRSSEKKSLIYDPEHELAEEKFAQTGDEKYLRRLPFFADQIEVIRQQVNRLAKEMEQKVELESTHNLARLVKVLRFATEDNLNTIRRTVSEKNENFQAVYWDALALAGTKTTISHLLEKINNKEVSPAKAAQLMKILAEVRIPSEQIAEELFRFCDSDIVSRNPVLRQSCWLSYGSLVHGVCGQHQNVHGAGVEEKKQCTRQTKEQYVNRLVEKMNRAETRYEKVLFVKVLANAGLDTSVVQLEKVIRDQQLDKVVRMQAVDALRRLRVIMPRKIQNILMPVYRSLKETPEMRMVALNMLLQTQPHKALLDMIVRGMEKERCQQVRVYTYSTLKTLAKSESPAEKEFSLRVAQAISSLPQESLNYLESKHNSYSWYRQQTGVTTNWATLFSNDSILPKEVTASLDSVFGGEWNKYLAQLGLVQNNLDVVLAKILQKVEETGIEQLVVRGKRSSSFFRPADMLRSLIESLRISHRQVSSDEPHAMLYLRYKDMDYAFLPIDVDTIPEMLRRVLREGQLDLSEIERVLAQAGRFTVSGAAFFHETVRKVPSALGLPLVMTAKMPTVAHITGQVKFELEPKNSERFTGLRVQLKAKPQIASTHVTRLEVLIPVGTVGIKLLQGGHLHTPIDAEIEFNWDKKMEIKTNFKTPEDRKHIVHIMSRPVVFVREWPKEARQYPEAREVTVQLSNSKFPNHEFERVYFEKTGLKMIVSGNYRRPFEALSAFGAENTMDIVIEPVEDAPKEIATRLYVSAFEQTEVEEPRLLNQFYDKQSEVFETEINTDYEQESREPERRSEFQNQLRQVKKSKAYKHKIQMKVWTVGGAKEQEAEVEIRGNCDEQMRYCRVNMDIHRSPVEGESRQWQMKSTAEWIYPQQPSSLKGMMEQPHREWTCVCHSKWGSDEQNTVNLRIQGEQSPEQKIWMKRFDREQNSLTQEQKLQEAAKLNQYKVDAEYQLTSEGKYWMENIYSLFKSYNLFSTDVLPKQNPAGRVQVKLTVEPATRQLCNLTVTTPTEQMSLRNVQMPFQLPTANIRSSFGRIKSVRHIVKAAERQSRPECVVKTKEVQTFDEVFYRTPMTPCYSVLAKDCTEKPEFAVLMKKVNKRGEEKKIKIISSDVIITLEKSEDKMIVKVNEKEVTDEEELEKVGVTKRSENNYHIDVEQVAVQFDGYQANLKMSRLFKNKQCGLCGHYDGEKTNEFRRADNEEVEDIEEFSRSYLHKDDECEMDESEMSEKRNYKVLREETSSSEEEYLDKETRGQFTLPRPSNANLLEPINRNRVLERGQKVCFSEKPVKMCPPQTKADKNDKRDVTFKCIDRSEHLAQKLMRKARKEDISEQLKELTEAETIEKEIRIPRTCSVY